MYFNSCMVRLEAIDTVEYHLSFVVFQFLYGTIGSSTQDEALNGTY